MAGNQESGSVAVKLGTDAAAETVARGADGLFERFIGAAADDAALVRDVAAEAFRAAGPAAKTLASEIVAATERNAAALAATAGIGGAALKAAGPSFTVATAFTEAMAENQGFARSAVIGVSTGVGVVTFGLVRRLRRHASLRDLTWCMICC
jgi:hypothetical protein